MTGYDHGSSYATGTDAAESYATGAYATGAPVLIVADDPLLAALAGDAVSSTEGRLVGCEAWRNAGARFDRQGALQVVLAEAGGVDAATIEQVMPRLAALTQGGGAALVVTFDPDQLDAVAGRLLGSGAELLCAPAVEERVAAVALALARRAPDRLHEAGHEAESVRLRRLSDEVARIADTLARLNREAVRGPVRPAVGERSMDYGAPPAGGAVAVSAADIRTAIRARRLRDKIIPGGLFEDPAWDMLLDLMAAELERGEVSVSSLCIAAAVAPTTALRWIGKLTDAGLVERRPDPFDKRRIFMGLTERARDGMRRYLASVAAEGLPIA